jgi:hypothetical protein
VGAGFLELGRGEGFHIGQSPHRHEAGGGDLPVGGNEVSCPRLGIGTSALANKGKSCQS